MKTQNVCTYILNNLMTNIQMKEFKFEVSFDKFKMQQSFHNMKIVGAVATADTSAAATYQKASLKLIADVGYKLGEAEHKTPLSWNRIPNEIFIFNNEKPALGFKIAKDRAILPICSNASGDLIVEK